MILGVNCHIYILVYFIIAIKLKKKLLLINQIREMRQNVLRISEQKISQARVKFGIYYLIIRWRD